MAKVQAGRFTAATDRDFVVFIIGMRVNHWWMFHKWIPVAFAMPRMLMKLFSDKSLGMLGAESFFRPFPLTTCMISYWESFEKLERFARDRTLPHAEAWARFLKNVGNNGSVGIYHETYQVKPGDFECVYGNMPLFGLAAATRHVPVGPGTDSAKDRIGR